MTWIQTLHGHDVDLLCPDLTKVKIEEVAHALSLINRFTGHTSYITRGYSVAQHSVEVSRHLRPEHAYAGLMHDAHEAFIGDISSPVKAALHALGGSVAFEELDQRAIKAVEKRWGLPSNGAVWAHVRQADAEALATERRDLMHECNRVWRCLDGITPWPERLVPMRPPEAAKEFLERFAKLSGGRQ
jgi:5'-deoxynucleotidase YfbR-like HD superfamily hydrolase